MKQRHELAGKKATSQPPTLRLEPGEDRLVYGDPPVLALTRIDTAPLERAIDEAPDFFRRKSRRHPMNPNQRVIVSRPSLQGRVNGIVADNAVFGWVPPAPLRHRESNMVCELNGTVPGVMAALCNLAVALDRRMEEMLPDQHEHLRTKGDEIASHWRFPGTGWTSCIVNDTAQLPYHLDGGNTKGTWSAMAVVRRFVTGGDLHLPDEDQTVRCENGTALMFCGSATLHGVTPFRVTRPAGGYRYTVVFYQRHSMTKDGTPAEALGRTQERRTSREEHMAHFNRETETLV